MSSSVTGLSWSAECFFLSSSLQSVLPFHCLHKPKCLNLSQIVDITWARPIAAACTVTARDLLHCLNPADESLKGTSSLLPPSSSLSLLSQGFFFFFVDFKLPFSHTERHFPPESSQRAASNINDNATFTRIPLCLHPSGTNKHPIRCRWHFPQLPYSLQ